MLRSDVGGMMRACDLYACDRFWESSLVPCIALAQMYA